MSDEGPTGVTIGATVFGCGFFLSVIICKLCKLGVFQRVEPPTVVASAPAVLTDVRIAEIQKNFDYEKFMKNEMNRKNNDSLHI